jgi:cation:H+ antiporter
MARKAAGIDTMTYLMVLGGLVLLLIGGEALVRGAVSIARKLNVSELVIGLILVGFGTSIPELVTSLQAVDQGSVGLAVGNVVGSNIANVFLVLALAAILTPIAVNPREAARGGFVVIAATVLFCALIWFDQFNRLTGTVMIGLLIGYVVFALNTGRAETAGGAGVEQDGSPVIWTHQGLVPGVLLVLAGLAGVIFGAHYLVTGASDLARSFGVSETVIGLTVVAVGTSLPELAACVVAAFRQRTGLALGTIIGSSIFNILGIMGITSLVRPFSVQGGVSAAAMAGDAPVSIISSVDVGALVLSAGLLILFAATGRRIARWEGAVLLLGYVIFMGLTFNLIPRLELIPNG